MEKETWWKGVTKASRGLVSLEYASSRYQEYNVDNVKVTWSDMKGWCCLHKMCSLYNHNKKCNHIISAMIWRDGR